MSRPRGGRCGVEFSPERPGRLVADDGVVMFEGSVAQCTRLVDHPGAPRVVCFTKPSVDLLAFDGHLGTLTFADRETVEVVVDRISLRPT